MNDDNELRSVDLGTDFDDQYVKWRSFAQTCAFCVQKKLHFDSIFLRCVEENGVEIYNYVLANIFDGTKFCIKKALKMAMIACKLPLIVIVAPSKLHSA